MPSLLVSRRSAERPFALLRRAKLRYCILVLLTFLALGQLLLPYVGLKAAGVTADVAKGAVQPTTRRALRDAPSASVCVVIRTYWGHGPRGSGSLQRMLDTLRASKFTRWQAMLLVMDSTPFPEMQPLVASCNDTRISIYANQIGEEYAPKKADGSGWNPQYHELLYNLTDYGIRACSRHTRWAAVTNGDNAYDEAFLDALEHVPASIGVVAFDYYSRYQRPTAGDGLPYCKENKLRFCQTDLGANVLNWRRFIAEGRSFAAMPSLGLGLNDGFLAQELVKAKWPVFHVRDRCLFSHAPSPQVCALEGGVWDDSTQGNYPGGRDCMTGAEAAAMMEGAAGQALELYNVSVSNDGRSFGMAARGGDELVLRCVRQAGEASRSQWINRYFPPQCSAAVDGGAL